jgi:hypothetical protein
MGSMNTRRLFYALWMLAIAGCDPGRIPEADKAKFLGCQLDVETDIFQAKCGLSGCHDAMTMMNGLDLASPGVATRLKTQVSTMCMMLPELTLIPEKLTSSPPCGQTMPVGNPLTTDEVKCVDDYIAKLADGGT